MRTMFKTRLAKAMSSSLLAGALLTGCAGLDPAQLESILRSTAGGAASLDEGTVVAGLKEALQVGTQRTVSATSKAGGFGLNDLIRIETPESLQPMAKGLRAIGFGARVDELENAMNLAAERAAGEATDVFWSAITQMSISDAFGILNGGETAATDYFRDRTSASLTSRFKPIVDEKMQQVGLYKMYQDLSAAYAALPLTSKPAVDLQQYVTDRSVAGLFTVLSQEETRIRQDPAARSTELLQRVFAR